MGKTLLRAHLRRKKRRRSLPCRGFSSCCRDDNTTIRKSSTSSLHKKQADVKKEGLGRILKTTKKASTAKVKLSNGQKANRLKRGCAGRTNINNAQLKKVIVNVTRLSEDVLGVLSEFGSICAGEVDSESFYYNSNPKSKSVGSPCLNAPARRLRSTPRVPVDRHTPSSVMDKLRVLNADWRSSSYPLSNNPPFSSKAPENVPLPGINMKTLFLENLLICKKASNDESTKENLKMTQNFAKPGDSLQQLKDKKHTTTSAAYLKSPLEPIKPKVAHVREPVTTRRSASSKSAMPSLPSKMKTPPFQSVLPQKQSSRPTILGTKPIIVGKSKLLAEENLSVVERSSEYVRYKSLLRHSPVRSENTIVSRRKQRLPMNRGMTPSKTDSKDKGVLESSKRPNTAGVPCGKSPGEDDSRSAAKKQKKDFSRDHEITKPTPATKTPQGKSHVYTIVLSDSSDDEHSYVLHEKVARPKPAVAKVNAVKKKTSPKHKSATKLHRGCTDAKANVSSRKKSSVTRASKNINSSKPQVHKKALPTKTSIGKKNSREQIQLSDSQSKEYDSSGARELSEFVETSMKRIRGSWNRGCRSCPGCQVDVPRKKQPKPAPVRNNLKPKLMNISSGSGSSVEVIIPKKDRCPPKPKSHPVIIHGLISSDDSLNNIQDEQVLGDGRKALVFGAERHGSEISEEDTSPSAENAICLPMKAIPEQVVDIDGSHEIRSHARSPSVHGEDTSTRNSEETDLPKANPSLEDSIKNGNLLKHSSQNFQVQRQGRETIQSSFKITESSHSIVSSGNPTSLEKLRSANSLMPCHRVNDSVCVGPDEASGAKDESSNQQSWKINNSHRKIPTPGICLVPPEDVQLSNGIDRPESQSSKKSGVLPLVVEYLVNPSCESLDRGPNFSPGPKEHHDVLDILEDSRKPIDCVVSNCSAFENAAAELNGVTNDSETSLVCNSVREQGSVLENKVVQDSVILGTGSLAIPAPEEIQMLQINVMPGVVNGGLDALHYQTSLDIHAIPGHENKCERPTESSNVVNFSNDVSNPSNTLFSEYGSEPQVGVNGTKELGQACKKSDAICIVSSLQDEVARHVTSDTHRPSLEDSHGTSIGSQEAPFKRGDPGDQEILQDNVPQMIAVDQNHGFSIHPSGSDGVLSDTDLSEKVSLDMNRVVDSLATTGECQGSDIQAPRENQSKSQEAISSKLSHLLLDCLNDLADSVKLDNREVIIRKVNIKSKETSNKPTATAEPGSLEESASVVKELNLLVPLNPRLMIRKLPLLSVGNATPSDVCSGDSKSQDSMSQDVDMSEDNVTRKDHQVPEESPRSTPDMTTPTKSLYERKGYPTPIRKLNPSVLSVIKYNDLEIDNDEPSLNDPPDTDLVECVTSEGVRFSLNPEDLSAIEDFLNIRTPVVDRPKARSPASNKETDANHTADDLVIDNDEPPLNPSPLKGARPPPTPDNEEDLEDLLIDNDAPPLNESAEAFTEVKPVSNDSDCLIISSDDEICTTSVSDPQLEKTLEVKIPPIPPSRLFPRPRKKLFRKKRSNVVDSVRSSSNHNQGNLPSRVELPRVNLQECPGVVNLEVFNFNELENTGDYVMNEVVNDCGLQTKRQLSGEPLPPFQSSKNPLSLVDNPITMNGIHNKDLCSREQEPGGISRIGSSNQSLFDLSDLEFLGGDVVDEIVIDDSGAESTSEPSSKPLPRFQGSQETLLQPQVFNLHGQPLKLSQDHFRDPTSNNASPKGTISTPEVNFDQSETFGDSSNAECLNISDSDTFTTSEDEGDVITVSPIKHPRSTVQTNVGVHKYGCGTKDSSHHAVSDSDDDLIVVSEPDRFTRVNQTRNFKPSTVNPPGQRADLRPQAGGFRAPRNSALPTFPGTQIRTVPSANGDFHYVLVVGTAESAVPKLGRKRIFNSEGRT